MLEVFAISFIARFVDVTGLAVKGICKGSVCKKRAVFSIDYWYLLYQTG